MDKSAVIKDYLMYPEKPFRLFGNRRFCFKGRCSIMTTAIGIHFTLFLITLRLGQAIYFSVKFYTVPLSKGISIFINTILYLIMVFMVLFVGFSNPGVFYPKKEILSSDLRIKSMLATIENKDFFLKYCTTCNIVRDLRVFHCRYCNLCVKRHDHHCPWLSICIGEQNHMKFLILLLISFFYLLFNALVLILTIIDAKIIHKREGLNLSVFDYVFFIITFSIDSLMLLFVVILGLLQIRNISRNETTSERIKRPKGGTNSYDLGSCSKNFSEFCCNRGGYRDRIIYNENAELFLKCSELLIDYIDNMDKVYPNRKDLISHPQSERSKTESTITEMTFTSLEAENEGQKTQKNEDEQI